ncbi:hypothetical protein AAMO2058_001033800 [Amorphochlora amoebiformis]
MADGWKVNGIRRAIVGSLLVFAALDLPSKQHKVAILGKKQSSGLVEDKFCGMRKTKKVKQMMAAMKRQEELAKQKNKKKSKADIENEKRAERLKYTNIEQPEVPPGVSPKSVLCEYFRVNLCLRGSKCKYGHDKSLMRAAKYDVAKHKSRFNLEKEIGDLEKLKQTAIVTEDYQYAQQLTDDIAKLKKQLWQQENKGCLQNVTEKLRQMEIEESEPPVTETQFLQWYMKVSMKQSEEIRAAERERRRRGILTGREFFVNLRASRAVQGPDHVVYEENEEPDASDAEGVREVVCEEKPSDQILQVEVKSPDSNTAKYTKQAHSLDSL